MSYQQRVYHWMLRYADPVSLREIARGTGLPYRAASFALLRLHKRLGLVRPTGPASKSVKWYVVDDSIQFIPDRRGKAEGSIAALAKASRARADMAAVKAIQAIAMTGETWRNSGGTVRPQETEPA